MGTKDYGGAPNGIFLWMAAAIISIWGRNGKDGKTEWASEKSKGTEN